MHSSASLSETHPDHFPKWEISLASQIGKWHIVGVRIIARSTIDSYAVRHPLTKASLDHWVLVARSAKWKSTSEVQAAFSKAKALNGERVRFEVAGGNHRMIVAFRFDLQIAFVKFIGTHANYDRVDALTVSQF
ncbi:type II toxin-antitoxin system HigB family toxin [Novosphingobium sp. JCM 18896]|uniref:type II toxin-antitoxin system HigB family toxin n=1 Tax=Novosphingobium sp. JCM 18896 TaxID=2989731 RepID=UPI0022234BD3|nr:type II toxin-antitoxin system HigB family toxin [Novosphingobium sp. JCM 18896]MCW1432113.1 type II toxin-antitoxin system HigB family toxin [Novosphingobium sp. JCM 18896]